MGGTGPMGMLAIDYALNGPIKPKNIVVTGRGEEKIKRVKELYQSNSTTKVSVVSVANVENQEKMLKEILDDGYDDIFIMIPNSELEGQASSLLNEDGCVNFFAGPQDKNFNANINFYDVHYSSTHYVGTSGGNTEDMRKAMKLIGQNK